MTWQHPEGGFGGGPGQAPHLLPTYASVCSLAIAGRPGLGGGWDQIDREGMYNFFMSLKQPDGSFLVAKHAEVDVRGIYCLLTTAALLDMLTPELVAGTAGFLASCQTYEGGFASSSHPSYSIPVPPPGSDGAYHLAAHPEVLPSPRPPLGEAHGGYTFCALAGWVLLLPFTNSQRNASSNSPALKINTSNLLRWLVHMQGIPLELGGFKGRTNKLVDGCYSWWCGGSFALLEALGIGGLQNAQSDEVPIDTEGDAWMDVDDELYNQKALQEYILYAGQHPAGGLRDKPPKNADAYHTLYCLSGLSSAQHHVFPSTVRRDQVETSWPSPKTEESSDDDAATPGPPPVNHPHFQNRDENLRKQVFSALLSWTEEEGAARIVGGAANRLNATHPVTNLTITHTEGIMSHFYGKKVPERPRAQPQGAGARS
ncbi:terpenoid cyclases/protein prenyltransferase alpha-alpha toroid [Crucibulum laeve]|uniref:Terpenoid cyclases/protein prenyltransferase alpha-alpha toroid n=1 Tax=Crucibulum laeve TaxID=68775 RepID=A0A5C3LS89_9AGAR|nr:terpenoid cyclases/protein prenyltransferase alpha-alpha toroid [Crucibulum laeve]